MSRPFKPLRSGKTRFPSSEESPKALNTDPHIDADFYWFPLLLLSWTNFLSFVPQVVLSLSKTRASLTLTTNHKFPTTESGT